MSFNIFKKNKKIDEKTGEEIIYCPRDSKAMKKLVKNDVILDVCPKCGGLWVDEGELEKLEQMANPKNKNKSTKIKKKVSKKGKK